MTDQKAQFNEIRKALAEGYELGYRQAKADIENRLEAGLELCRRGRAAANIVSEWESRSLGGDVRPAMVERHLI